MVRCGNLRQIKFINSLIKDSGFEDTYGEINDVTYINAPLEVVLDGIGFMNDFEYERKGKKVYIK